MDKFELFMYLWYCFLLGVVIDSWVSLTQEVWRDLCRERNMKQKNKDTEH